MIFNYNNEIEKFKLENGREPNENEKQNIKEYVLKYSPFEIIDSKQKTYYDIIKPICKSEMVVPLNGSVEDISNNYRVVLEGNEIYKYCKYGKGLYSNKNTILKTNINLEDYNDFTISFIVNGDISNQEEEFYLFGFLDDSADFNANTINMKVVNKTDERYITIGTKFGSKYKELVRLNITNDEKYWFDGKCNLFIMMINNSRIYLYKNNNRIVNRLSNSEWQSNFFNICNAYKGFNSFNGIIKQIRVFNKILSNDDISKLNKEEKKIIKSNSNCIDYVEGIDYNEIIKETGFYNFNVNGNCLKTFFLVEDGNVFLLVGYFRDSAKNAITETIPTKNVSITENPDSSLFSSLYGNIYVSEVRYIGVDDLFNDNWKDNRKIDFSHGIQTGRKWKYVYTDGRESGMGSNSRYGFHVTYCKNNVYNWKTNANFMRMNDNNPSISSRVFENEGTFRLSASNDGELGIAYNRSTFGHDDYLSAGFGRDDGNSFFFDSNKSNKGGNSKGGVRISSKVYVLIKIGGNGCE